MQTRSSLLLAFGLLISSLRAVPAPEPPVNSALIPATKLEEDSYDWFARHAEILRIKDKLDPEVVLIGDSITHFWGGQPQPPHPNGPQSWENTFGNYRTLNLGFGWDRIQNVLWRLDHGELDGLHPRMVVLHIGTNNTSETEHARQNTPEEIAEGIRTIIQRVRAKLPDTRIVLMAVFPREQKPDHPRRAQITEINRLLSTFAQQAGITYLDLGPKMLDSDGTISTSIMSDFCHPTERGYQIWGNALAPLLAALKASPAQPERREDPVKHSRWEGFERLDFQVNGHAAWLVLPNTRAEGSPWIWRTEFFGHEPQADLALLRKGFHAAYIDVQNLYGAPIALDLMDAFYEVATQRYQLSPRPVLEGFSRGGLFAFNWAARHPDRVAGIYVDAPVCDFKSWPAGWGKGPGSASDWQRCKEVYGLTDEQARAYRLNPVDNLAGMAAQKIPILSVCGGADEVVPFEENTALVQKRYLELGGPITVIVKPGVHHHPHSLKDPTRIVDFVLRATASPAVGGERASETIVLPDCPESRDARLQWWRAAKFGLFIHWGPSSVLGKEISWSRQGHPFDHPGNESVPANEYDKAFQQFNPVKFNAGAWMSLAREAGMKYVVLITKHHDGFSMWPTRQRPEYSIAATPFQRDICREISEAARAQGLKLGWYYSTRDWTHPDYLQGDNARYNQFYESQVAELLSNYGKVDVLWFDHVAGNWRDYQFQRLFNRLYQLQPELVVNNRAARFIRPTQDHPSPELASLVDGDFDTPEQEIGKFQSDRAWESCVTLTQCADGGGWSYRPDGRTRTFDECLRLLVNCVTGDGNLLLNVGPLPSGEIDPGQITVLKQLGGWLKTYGASVYETRGGPFHNGTWGGSTYHDNSIYLHVRHWNGETLKLPPLRSKVVKTVAMTGGTAQVEQSETGLTVTLPVADQQEIDTVIRLDLEGSAEREFKQGKPLAVAEQAK